METVVIKKELKVDKHDDSLQDFDDLPEVVQSSVMAIIREIVKLENGELKPDNSILLLDRIKYLRQQAMDILSANDMINQKSGF